MNRRIVMDRGNVVKIAKTMNCTREMVSKALNFKKDSMLARKIRYVAKEQYEVFDSLCNGPHLYVVPVELQVES